MINELNKTHETFCRSAKMSLYSFPITELDSIANITTFDIYVKLKSPILEQEIIKIKGIGDKNERDIQKRSTLPTVTPSGIFSKRDQKYLITHTGIICIDFDDVADVKGLKERLLSDREIETLLLFLSPSGDGLKWFVRIPPNEFTHILYFLAIENYILETIKFQVDKSCKNISRACFLSYDPDAYINYGNPKELGEEFLNKWMPKIEEKSSGKVNMDFDDNINIIKVQSIVDQLQTNQINIAEDYEDWLRIGFSLCSLEELGRDFFHSISKQSSKYEKCETDKKYSLLLSNYNGNITLGTLFYFAKQYGVIPKIEKENIINQIPVSNSKSRMDLRTMPERLLEAKQLPKLERLLGNIWCKGEVHILFGDNGTGKSVWATQIADSLAKGISTFDNLPNQTNKQTVLFYDFELSDIQIIDRYSDDAGNIYPFSSNLILDSWDFTDPHFTDKKVNIDQLIIDKIKEDIIKYDPKVLIIDNISFLKTEATHEAKVALDLIKSLITLKKEYNLSILILAHTPKVKLGLPITNNDLAGSKHLSNFADSISAIGISSVDKNIKYIKSIKCRSTEKEFDAANVIMVMQEKIGNFLQFTYLDQGNEYELIKDPMKIVEEELDEVVKNEIVNLYNHKVSYRKIAEQTGLSKSTICRIIQKHKSDRNVLL
jgi:archaellum biogenesis ATPase FlaH